MWIKGNYIEPSVLNLDAIHWVRPESGGLTASSRWSQSAVHDNNWAEGGEGVKSSTDSSMKHTHTYWDIALMPNISHMRVFKISICNVSFLQRRAKVGHSRECETTCMHSSSCTQQFLQMSCSDKWGQCVKSEIQSVLLPSRNVFR